MLQLRERLVDDAEGALGAATPREWQVDLGNQAHAVSQENLSDGEAHHKYAHYDQG